MRNNNLDLLKVVMAFLVVALHIFPVTKVHGLEGLFSFEIASGITRIAVPTFFLISGYFLRYKLNDAAYLWKYGKRILTLYVVWQLIYLPDLIRYYHLGWFSKRAMFLKLLYGYWHLWYLLATVLAVFLLYVTNCWRVSIKFFVSFFLVGVGYVLQLLVHSGIFSSYSYFLQWYEAMGTTRNFLFFAFPMMQIGSLYEYWENLAQKTKLIYGFIWIALLLEVAWYYNHHVKAMDFLVVLPLLSMLTFYRVKTAPNFYTKKINPTLSLGIYLCHPYAIRIVNSFIPYKTFYHWFYKYPLICFVSLILWWIVFKINKKIPYFY